MLVELGHRQMMSNLEVFAKTHIRMKHPVTGTVSSSNKARL